MLRRLITGERRREQAAELAHLTTVAAQMKAGAVSIDEVEALRQYIRSGKGAPPSRMGGGEYDEQRAPVDEPHMTQLEMNEAAREKLDEREVELEDLLIEISGLLSPDEFRELRAAQDKWLAFREAHSEFVAKLFEGGSMRPLWYVTAKDTATKDRLRELTAYLEVRKLG